MIFTGKPGANPLWCRKHWQMIIDAGDNARIGLPLSVALMLRITEKEAFQIACDREPSRINDVMNSVPFDPVCCYLGDEEFLRLCAEVRDALTLQTMQEIDTDVDVMSQGES